MITIRRDLEIAEVLEVKRSRFLSFLYRTDTEEAARDYINQLRARFPDARHHCSAFIVARPGHNPLMHSSDDGEPSGTAGPPMLTVLQHADLSNVCAVVVRFFGGTLLGTGGLTRAYTDATQMVVEQAPLVEIKQLQKLRIRVPVALGGKIEGDLRAQNLQVLQTSWSDAVEIEVAVPRRSVEQTRSMILSGARGQAQIEQCGQLSVEVDKV